MKYRGAIFDLDGVLVDTAKYHYLAWKTIADRLGFSFSLKDNERLKGVSRMRSLDILLEVGNMEGRFTERERASLAEEKNKKYVEYISNMDSSEILPGVLNILTVLKKKGVKTALGSASKNSSLILKSLSLEKYFDVIIDGNSVSKAKPDPEVFAAGAKALGENYEDCVVFEDSEAGLMAASGIKMHAVGIGLRENLPSADEVYSGFEAFPTDKYF